MNLALKMRWNNTALKVSSTQMAAEGLRVGELCIILKNLNIYSGGVWMDNKARKPSREELPTGCQGERCL